MLIISPPVLITIRSFVEKSGQKNMDEPKTSTQKIQNYKHIKTIYTYIYKLKLTSIKEW